MNMNEQVDRLIESIKSKTEKDQAEWKKTSSSREFQLKLNNGRITTDSYRTETDEGDFDVVEIRLYNKNGDEIYHRYFSLQKNPSDYNKLMSFYNVVDANYYKSNETIMGMLSEAESNDTLGKEDELPF